MTILILSNSDSGLVQFRKELIEFMLKEHTVYCSVPNADGYIDSLEELGCKCIVTDFERQGTNPVNDLILLNKYKRIITDIKPDVVLTYTIKPNVYGGIACQIKKTRYLANVTGLGITIENGGLIGRISLALYRIGLRRAQCVFFQNTYNKNFFINKRIVRGNAKLIPGSGVNTETHSFEPYPCDETPFRFLFVGRVMKDKGIEELLTALKMQVDEDKQVFLDIVGGSDEDYSTMLHDYEALGIIKYHGRHNDVHPFYSHAHCVVLPSYHEGMSNVMLEAASTGRPVITCNIPGCRETFNEGVTGFGCEVRNAENLKKAMDKMINTPWEDRKKMGLAGREKVKREFDRQIIIDAYMEQIYKRESFL